jgi:F420-0:gamma-glutamyl ligase
MMKVDAIKTALVTPSSHTIEALLAAHLPKLAEQSVVAVSSKVISLCEGRVVPRADAIKTDLVKQEAERYLPAEASRYNQMFTITRNTLIAVAGIDESNAGDYYILWPTDPQASANRIREFLSEHFGIKNVGVVVTDSTSQPLRRGTTGIVLAHSGFQGLEDYIGKPDLFGRPFAVSQGNTANGLAATATLVMGEGTEQTPLCVMTDVPFVQFQARNPSPEELAALYVNPAEDLFAPFTEAVDWQS